MSATRLINRLYRDRPYGWSYNQGQRYRADDLWRQMGVPTEPLVPPYPYNNTNGGNCTDCWRLIRHRPSPSIANP